MYTEFFPKTKKNILKNSLWYAAEVTLTLSNLAALFHLMPLLEMYCKLRFLPEAIEKWNENDVEKKILKQKIMKRKKNCLEWNPLAIGWYEQRESQSVCLSLCSVLCLVATQDTSNSSINDFLQCKVLITFAISMQRKSVFFPFFFSPDLLCCFFYLPKK